MPDSSSPWDKFLIQKWHDKITDICVIVLVPLVMTSYLNFYIMNSQQSMLVNPMKNKHSIQKFN